MTDGTSRPVVFGDIHELLRKVNGESEPAYMWQSDKPKEEITGDEAQRVDEEQPREARVKPAKEPSPKESSLSSTEETADNKPSESTGQKLSQKVQRKPRPSMPVRKKESKEAERNGKKESLSNGSRTPFSKDDILSQIEDFSCDSDTGRRHWVFLPDDIVATLEAVYGSHRISAIITALARSFIDANKDDLRRLVTHRSGLF